MRPLSKPDCPVVILGAGPAGLTAAYELIKYDVRSVVLEKDSTVGGISRTTSCLGLEYFCFEGDGLWNTADADLAARNIVSEMRGIGPRYDLWKVNAGEEYHEGAASEGEDDFRGLESRRSDHLMIGTCGAAVSDSSPCRRGSLAISIPRAYGRNPIFR